jgi:glycosyltransferase involved in cell wall biosynthesis
MNENQPTISVLTPTWNRGVKMLNRCMTCVNWQSFEDWEHVIVSDGQDPALREYFSHTLKDENKRRFIELDENHNDYGASVRKIAMPMLKGKYIAFLDDDNIIFPEFLEEMVGALEGTSSDVGFAVCQIVHMGPLQAWVGRPPQILQGWPIVVGGIDTLQVVVKKEAIENVGWVSEGGFFSDGYTYEALAKEYRHVRVEKILGIHI